MVASDARDVCRLGELNVSESVGLGRDAIGGSSGLQCIQRDFQRAITDDMDVKGEAGHVETPDELRNHGRIMLGLSAGYAALAGMKAVRLREGMNRGRSRSEE